MPVWPRHSVTGHEFRNDRPVDQSDSTPQGPQTRLSRIRRTHLWARFVNDEIARGDMRLLDDGLWRALVAVGSQVVFYDTFLTKAEALEALTTQRHLLLTQASAACAVEYQSVPSRGSLEDR